MKDQILNPFVNQEEEKETPEEETPEVETPSEE